MSVFSIEGGYDTTHTADRPDRALIEHRMRVLLSTIACEMFDVPVPDHIDEDEVIPRTPENMAASAWRTEMYAALGLSMPVADIEPEPEPVQVPDAPAADPSGHARVIATIPAVEDDWRTRGACRDEDAELFFPVGTSGPALLQAEQAKAACRRCPVQDACLEWAIDSAGEGVWGGMTDEERRAERTRRGLWTPERTAA